MRFSDVIAALEGDILVEGDHLHDRVGHIVATDLMSEVLLGEDDDLLMFTNLTTEHAVRTAHVMGALGVVVLAGKQPRPAMCRAATELGVTLAVTPLPRESVMTWAAAALPPPV